MFLEHTIVGVPKCTRHQVWGGVGLEHPHGKAMPQLVPPHVGQAGLCQGLLEWAGLVVSFPRGAILLGEDQVLRPLGTAGSAG